VLSVELPLDKNYFYPSLKNYTIYLQVHPAGVQVRVCVITPHAPQLAEHVAVLHADQLDD